MSRPAVPVVMILALLVATACTDQPTPAQTAGPESLGTSDPTATAAGPTYPPYEEATVAAFDPAQIRIFPPDAVIGTPYPVDLVVHCPIGLIGLGGTSWRAERPAAEEEQLAMAQTLGEQAPPDGHPGVVSGTMELLDADTARLVIDQQYWDSPVDVVIYRKTAQPLPGCQ